MYSFLLFLTVLWAKFHQGLSECLEKLSREKNQSYQLHWYECSSQLAFRTHHKVSEELKGSRNVLVALYLLDSSGTFSGFIKVTCFES